jgi:acyl carrier protein
VSTDNSEVLAIIDSFLEGIEKGIDGMTGETGLYGGGLELDSLEVAELSSRLEDELGSDPFSAAQATGDEMPETVGAVLAFYGGDASG